MIRGNSTKSYKNLNLNFVKGASFRSPCPSLKKEQSEPKIQTLATSNTKPAKIFPTSRFLKITSTQFNTTAKALMPTNRTARADPDISPKTKNTYTITQQPKRPKILNRVRSISQCSSLSFDEQFSLGKVLGKGRFGNVCLAQHL